MRRRTSLAVLPVIALVLSLSACGGSSEQQQQQQKAQKRVCGARADIARRVDQLGRLTPATATIGGVQASIGAIQDDLRDIAAARGKLDADRRARVKAAADRFTARLTALVQDATSSLSLSDARAKLERAAGELRTAYRETLGTIDC